MDAQTVTMIRGGMIAAGALILLAVIAPVIIQVAKGTWGGIKTLPKTLLDSIKEFFRLAVIVIPALLGISLLFFVYRSVSAGYLPSETLVGHIVLVQLVAISATFGKKAYKLFYAILVLLVYGVVYYFLLIQYGQEWWIASTVAMIVAGLASMFWNLIRYHRVGKHILSSTLLGLAFHIPVIFALQQLGVGI